MANNFISFELGNYDDKEEEEEWEDIDDDSEDLKVHPVYSHDENEKICELTAAIREFESEKKNFDKEKEKKMENMHFMCAVLF